MESEAGLEGGRAAETAEERAAAASAEAETAEAAVAAEAEAEGKAGAAREGAKVVERMEGWESPAGTGA